FFGAGTVPWPWPTAENSRPVMEAVRWPPKSQSLVPKSYDQATPFDPLLHDQLSKMGQEISHLLLRAGPPKDLEFPKRPTVEKESKRWVPLPDDKPKVTFATAKAPELPGQAPLSEGVAGMCSRCPVLNMQVRALSQSLAGLGAKAFNWSSGLSKLQRRDLAEVVLEYCRPCAHLDSTL
ncbi:unnamed protein product, partial [Effrenium voratum]